MRTAFGNGGNGGELSCAQVRDRRILAHVVPRYLPYTVKGGASDGGLTDVSDVWDALVRLDASEEAPEKAPGGRIIRLIYSGYELDPGARDHEYRAGWTREHIWPRSHGGFDVHRPGIGTDLHNLFAADASVNSARSDRDFDDGGEPVVDPTPAPGCDGHLRCRAGDGAWEPPDESKGVVARAAMYMACMYGGPPWNLRLVERRTGRGESCLGRLSALRAWAAARPPSARELRRNDMVERWQGNRNPFVDDPTLAERTRF